jgi:hypothetical protein
MTAVEWLVEQVADRGLDCGSGIRMKIQVPKDIAEQANAMFEQQIIDASNQTEFEDIDGMGIHDTITKGEQYYNETFKKD